MPSNVQVVFWGEVLEGFEVADVKRRFARALRLEETHVAQLFTGARTVLRRSVDEATGRLYVDKLALLGARVHLEPTDAPPTSAFPTLPDVPDDEGPPPPPWGIPPPTLRPGPTAPTSASPAAPQPLALQPAEPEITCPNCGERQSKRLLCRHCATNIPMALAAKEEEAARAREDQLNAREARRGGVRPAYLTQDAAVFFGPRFDGRMGRFAYWSAGSIDIIAIVLALTIFAQRPSVARAVFLALALLAVLFASFRQTVLRLHDFNWSGWWSLVTFVPVLGLVAMIVIALCPGSDDENDFGPPPRDWHWGVLACAMSAATLVLLFGWAKLVQLAAMADESFDDAAGDHAAQQAPIAPPPAVATREQRAAFEAYSAAGPHRAFAISPAGGWGWVGNRATPRDAVMAAFQECEARRPAYSGPCELVDVNGQRAPGQ